LPILKQNGYLPPGNILTWAELAYFIQVYIGLWSRPHTICRLLVPS